MEKKETNIELEIKEYKSWCKTHNKSEKNASSLSEYLKSLEDEKRSSLFKYLGEHIEDAKMSYEYIARFIEKLEMTIISVKHHASNTHIENDLSIFEFEDVCHCMTRLLNKSDEALKLLRSSVELVEYVKNLQRFEANGKDVIVDVDKTLIDFIKTKN